MKVLHSIKGKLILFTLCISLIPISIITTVYYLNARSTLKTQILQQLTAIAESKKIHALSFMEAKRGRTIDFSSDGFIRDSLETIAQRGTQSNAVYNLDRHLKTNKKLIDPQIKEIAVIGLDGIVVSSTNQRVIGNDVSTHELFVKSINNKFGETYVGQTYCSPYLNENCIFISAPITSKQGGKGETIGVIVNAYSLASLNEITANRIGMGKTGEVYLVNRDKVMMTESRFIADAVIHQVVDTEPVRRIMRGDKGMVGIYPDYRGVSIVGASVDILEYGWTLLAEVDKAEAFASLWNLRKLVLVMGGVCSAVAIAIGITFSLSIARPINRLKYATEKIADGNLKHRVDITSKDEIGALANSFNNMTSKLTYEITERKNMEEELTKVQRLESLGILAGGIAHDFNNSLQAILGCITLAELHADSNSRIHEYLAGARKTVLQTKGLSRQLLTFSKGGAPVKKAVFLPDIITNSTKLALSGSNVKCEFDIPENILLIEADKGQLNQVFSNLVINAVQAMPEGGVIKIYVENINLADRDLLPLQKGRYVEVRVEDHGIGVSQEYLQKIFDPYFTTKPKGNGLGLATTFSIIKKHDGHISVESEIGVGTIFRIYLPASNKEIRKISVPSEVKRASTAPVDKKNKEKPNVSKGKVLLMDDEYVIRVALDKHLKHLNYEVETVEEGSEAIGLYKSALGSDKPFDSVIIDLTISGGMGGKEVIERLLEIDPEVTAIVMSGYANDTIMANYKEYGFRGVLAKPHEIHELDEALQKVIAEAN